MPFGPYADFNACLIDQRKKGHSDESAHKICGAMQAELEKSIMGDDPMKQPPMPNGAEVNPPEDDPNKKPFPIVNMPFPGSQSTDTEEFALDPGAKPKLNAALSFIDEYSRSVSIVASTQNPAGDQPGIAEWDLERFKKNPVVLWSHRSDEMPIGLADEIGFGPEGLTMRVHFATAKANPFAEEVWNAVREGVVRACSVGYELVGASKGKLLEVSMVPVGLDEDAGTPLLNPEAEMTEEERTKAAVSKAAGELARHRARVRRKLKEEAESATRTDSAGDPDTVYRSDVARLGKAKRNAIGGVEVEANLTRTGVLEYHLPDGTVRRELRPASEVFKADSLETLRFAPVIDVRHHTGMVTPETWSRSALGLVAAVRKDGKYVSGTLHINDADAIRRVDEGERADISCGYTCTLDRTPGEIDGVKYDCIQKNIRYNHAALCAPNGGRAGPDVGLRFDNSSNRPTWGISHEAERTEIMTVKIRLDGRDYEVGSAEHLDKIETTHKAEVSQLRTDAKTELDKAVAEVAKRADAAEGRADTAEKALEEERADAKKSKTKGEEDYAAKEKGLRAHFARKLRLVRSFVRWFSSDDDGDEDGKGKDDKDGDEKMDKLDDELLSLSERDLMLKAIMRVDAKFDGKAPDGTDRSDDYVQAVFDSTIARVKHARSIHGVVEAVETAKRADARDVGTSPTIEKARSDHHNKLNEMWRAKPSAQNGGAR